MASHIAPVVSAVATAVVAGSVAVAVSAATKASPKDLVETVTPLGEKIVPAGPVHTEGLFSSYFS